MMVEANRENQLVSPGFTPRPWLSAVRTLDGWRGDDRVAGVYAPALVER